MHDNLHNNVQVLNFLVNRIFSEVVDILQSVPIETILEGDLTADDMVVIFQDSAIFDDMDFSGLSSELISSLDVNQLGRYINFFVLNEKKLYNNI